MNKYFEVSFSEETDLTGKKPYLLFVDINFKDETFKKRIEKSELNDCYILVDYRRPLFRSPYFKFQLSNKEITNRIHENYILGKEDPDQIKSIHFLKLLMQQGTVIEFLNKNMRELFKPIFNDLIEDVLKKYEDEYEKLLKDA